MSKLVAFVLSLSVISSPVSGLFMYAGSAGPTFGSTIFSFSFQSLLCPSLKSTPASVIFSNLSKCSLKSLSASIFCLGFAPCLLFGLIQVVPKHSLCGLLSSALIRSLTSSIVNALLFASLVILSAALSVAILYF